MSKTDIYKLKKPHYFTYVGRTRKKCGITEVTRKMTKDDNLSINMLYVSKTLVYIHISISTNDKVLL